MHFDELINKRQSCRKYDKTRKIPDEIIRDILESAILSPSACNSQPYHITVCRNEQAKLVSRETMGMWLNKFTEDADVMLVISEKPYGKTAALGAKLKNNDYRSIDIGILSAFITLKATELGIGSCILGWFNDKEIRKYCNLDSPVRLVISLGYPAEDDTLRTKKRKNYDELIKHV